MPLAFVGSPMQILVIVLIILLLFGASRLGEVGKGLGEGIRNFKKTVGGEDDDKSPPEAKKALKDGDSTPSETASQKTASSEKQATDESSPAEKKADAEKKDDQA